MVARRRRGSRAPSLRRATSSAWSWSSCSREKPVLSTCPSSATMTAPTEKAEADGGHCRDSSTAQARNRRSAPPGPSREGGGQRRRGGRGGGEGGEKGGGGAARVPLVGYILGQELGQDVRAAFD